MKKLATKDWELLKEPSLVKFGIEGCMPCYMAEETLKEIEPNFPNVNFYTNNDTDLMASLGIESMPVIYIINGESRERINAYECLDDLEEIITNKLEKE